jgi:F420-dependent oxidoreductase-like protein
MKLDIFGSANTVDRLVEDIASAAAQGFARFWTPQIRDIDALTAFAVAGREVPDIRLGTNVVPTWVRHPTMLAQQALTVNQVIDGRLDLGVGLSHKPVVEGFWGIPFERPVRHMSDYLKVLMPLMNGEPASHTGEMVSGRMELGVRAPAAPVYVAALGEQMLKLAGRYANGTTTWMTGPVTVEELTGPTLRAAATDAGRPDPELFAAVPVLLTGDVDAAKERAAIEYDIYGKLPSYRTMLDREGIAGPEDLAIIGDEATVEAGLRRFADAGATTVIANPFGSKDEVAYTREFLASLL